MRDKDACLYLKHTGEDKDQRGEKSWKSKDDEEMASWL